MTLWSINKAFNWARAVKRRFKSLAKQSLTRLSISCSKACTLNFLFFLIFLSKKSTTFAVIFNSWSSTWPSRVSGNVKLWRKVGTCRSINTKSSAKDGSLRQKGVCCAIKARAVNNVAAHSSLASRVSRVDKSVIACWYKTWIFTLIAFFSRRDEVCSNFNNKPSKVFSAYSLKSPCNTWGKRSRPSTVNANSALITWRLALNLNTTV